MYMYDTDYPGSHFLMVFVIMLSEVLSIQSTTHLLDSKNLQKFISFSLCHETQGGVSLSTLSCTVIFCPAMQTNTHGIT